MPGKERRVAGSFLANARVLAGKRRSWNAARPFPHLVIDGFLAEPLLHRIVDEFPAYEAAAWYTYDNAIENKKAMNGWDRFGPSTYRLFTYLNSNEFVGRLEALTGERLVPDFGLNGGGLHSHARGGKLNVHLDYSLHPKLGLQRRINLLIYVTPDWNEEWGGHLEFWTHDRARNRPKALAKKVAPLFNRAVIFDTTRNSWHGLPAPIRCPATVRRNSLALYYLGTPAKGASERGRALFAPTAEQEGDPAVLDLIRQRSSVSRSKDVYVKK